jgi:phytoene dehydrogenase-like protein
MANKSVIIIGAGLSGLAAGCYGQMNGYKTEIFEMHNKSGGVCTSWKRKGYTIGTAGWLTGSGPENNDFYNFWKELGALQGLSFVNYEEFVRIEGPDGKELIITADIDRLGNQLHEIAPEDSEFIDEFINTLHGFMTFKMDQTKPPELNTFFEKIKLLLTMLPTMLGPQGKWMKMTIKDFAQQFKNPFLRDAFGKGALHVLFYDDCQAGMMLLNFLSYMHLKIAGYPIGGLQKVVEGIEKRYLDLGGELHFRSRVDKILVEPDPSGRGVRAVGVRLDDGTEYRAEVVISAADGRTTIFDMLEGKYVNAKVKKLYDNPKLFPPLFFMSLGVNRILEKSLPSVGGKIYQLTEPIMIAGKEWDQLGVHIYDFDPTVAPAGKTLLRIWLPTDYDYWKNLRDEDRTRYREEKKKIVEQVIARLDQIYPGLAHQVDMWDAATPATFERYTGNWRASYMGWLFTPESMMRSIDKTLPRLDNFYMIGQWVGASSLPFAATSGRHITQILCHKDKKPFVTTMP